MISIRKGAVPKFCIRVGQQPSPSASRIKKATLNIFYVTVFVDLTVNGMATCEPYTEVLYRSMEPHGRHRPVYFKCKARTVATLSGIFLYLLTP